MASLTVVPKPMIELAEELDALVGGADDGDAHAGREQDRRWSRVDVEVPAGARARRHAREIEADAEDDAIDLVAAEDAALQRAEHRRRGAAETAGGEAEAASVPRCASTTKPMVCLPAVVAGCAQRQRRRDAAPNQNQMFA